MLHNASCCMIGFQYMLSATLSNPGWMTAMRLGPAHTDYAHMHCPRSRA